MASSADHPHKVDVVIRETVIGVWNEKGKGVKVALNKAGPLLVGPERLDVAS